MYSIINWSISSWRRRIKIYIKNEKIHKDSKYKDIMIIYKKPFIILIDYDEGVGEVCIVR